MKENFYLFLSTMGFGAIIAASLVLREFIIRLPLIILASGVAVCLVLITYTACAIVYRRNQARLLEQRVAYLISFEASRPPLLERINPVKLLRK